MQLQAGQHKKQERKRKKKTNLKCPSQKSQNKANIGTQKYSYQFFCPFLKVLLINIIFCPTEAQCIWLPSQNTVTNTNKIQKYIQYLILKSNLLPLHFQNASLLT